MATPFGTVMIIHKASSLCRQNRMHSWSTSLNQDFHFGILGQVSIHSTGSFATAILHSRRQRAVWQPGVRLSFRSTSVAGLPAFCRTHVLTQDARKEGAVLPVLPPCVLIERPESANGTTFRHFQSQLTGIFSSFSALAGRKAHSSRRSHGTDERKAHSWN